MDGFWLDAHSGAIPNHLVALDLQLPHLSEVLAFEQAVLATLVDDQSRVVTFDFDPLPLFRALA